MYVNYLREYCNTYFKSYIYVLISYMYISLKIYKIIFYIPSCDIRLNQQMIGHLKMCSLYKKLYWKNYSTNIYVVEVTSSE